MKKSVILADQCVKMKESEIKDKYLDLAKEFKKKAVQHEEVDVVIDVLWMVPKCLEKTGGIGNRR